MRSTFGWYLKGMPGAAKIRFTLNRSISPDEIREIIYSYRDKISAGTADQVFEQA
jgi:tRNA-dihydrouridine synthase